MIKLVFSTVATLLFSLVAYGAEPVLCPAPEVQIELDCNAQSTLDYATRLYNGDNDISGGNKIGDITELSNECGGYENSCCVLSHNKDKYLVLINCEDQNQSNKYQSVRKRTIVVE